MPGIAWAALIVWSALTGSTLLGPPKAWDGVDPTSNKHPHYRPSRVEYRTWTSSPQVTREACTYTIFALATREKIMRLKIGGVEQLVDHSWSWEQTLPIGKAGTISVVEFLDPIGGRVVATHEVWESCPRSS